jgi:hypothetical protein
MTETARIVESILRYRTDQPRELQETARLFGIDDTALWEALVELVATFRLSDDGHIEQVTL